MDAATRQVEKVYPRGCGGTGYENEKREAVEGLSPRVRGNPNFLFQSLSPPRSIPAGAGEPRADWDKATDDEGLSPRVRGNPPPRMNWESIRRSIPAGAGEPRFGRR